MFSTIRARLIWLVLFALLPALAIIVYDEIQFRRRIFQEIHREAAKVGSLVQERTESLIEESRAQLRALARMQQEPLSPTTSRLWRCATRRTDL